MKNCKYKITLSNGEEIILNSITSDTSLSSFEKSLKNVFDSDPEKLSEIIKSIENSKKITLNIDNINDVSSIIGTTSVKNIIKTVSKNTNADTQNELVDGIRSIGKWIEENSNLLGFPDINTNNIIASSFDSNQSFGLLTKYFQDRKFLLIDVNQLSNSRYENILKGLVDYTLDMLGNDESFKNNILNGFKNYKTYDEFRNDLMELPNRKYDRKYDLILNIIERRIGININTLKKMYNLSNYVINNTNFEKSLISTKGNPLENQASSIYKKYVPFLKNVDMYYSENQEFLKSDDEINNFPFIQSGDLIKFYDGKLANGIFYIYIGTYEPNSISINGKSKVVGKREHVIISPQGYIKTVTDDELLNESNKFTYKKNISTKDDKIDYSKKYNYDLTKDSDKYYHINYSEDEASNDLLKHLDNGDIIYVKKFKSKSPIAHYVLGVSGNSLVVEDSKGVRSTFNIDGLNNIKSIKMLKENHSELSTIDSSTISDLYNIENGFISKNVNKNNLKDIIENLKIGDIVKVASGNNVFHNLVLGFNSNKSEISILTSTGRTVSISPSDILTVIYNYKYLKNDLNKSIKNRDKAEKILDNFKNGSVPTYPGNTLYNDYLSVIDVSIPSPYTNNLKTGIESGDFIDINNQLYIVLSVTPTKVVALNKNNIPVKVDFNGIKHIIKSDLKLGFEDNTLKINSWLVGSELDNNFNKVLNSGKFEKIEVKYVRSINFKNTPIKFLESNKIPAAYWVTIDEYNKNKNELEDLTNNISNSLYSEQRKMYAINATTKTNKNFRLKDFSGYINISNINTLDINSFMSKVTKGMMIGLNEERDFKTYRIEYVQNRGTNQGLYLSYSIMDNNGKINSFIKFVSKNDITKDEKVNISALYSPYYFNANNSIKKEITLNNYKNKLELVKDSDKIESFLKISEYLQEKFGVQLLLVSKNEIPYKELNKTTSDKINAYILNGKIYVNTDSELLLEPIHEMMHLLLGVMKVKSPNEYITLLENSKKHPDFKELFNLYKGNTRLDIYEEIFINLFTDTLRGKINDNGVFQISDLDNLLKSTLKSTFSLNKDIDNISAIESLEKSTKDLLNEYESDLFLDTISYYDESIALNSIKVSTIKKKMLENNELEENCYE